MINFAQFGFNYIIDKKYMFVPGKLKLQSSVAAKNSRINNAERVTKRIIDLYFILLEYN